MASPAARRSIQDQALRSIRRNAVAVAVGIALAIAAVPMIFTPEAAYAKTDRPLLAAFAGDPALTASQLEKQRGGWYLPNGALINFGLEIQQIVNHSVVNDIKWNQVRNNFTVTQDVPNGSTTVTQNIPNDSTTTSLPGGNEQIVTTVTGSGNVVTTNTGADNTVTTLTTNVVNGSVQNQIQITKNNAPITTLNTNALNGSIQNLVQNSQNNLPIQTVTTLNISTQGFQSALHNVTTTAQILNTVQMNSWMHH